jgi:hypothetical protein
MHPAEEGPISRALMPFPTMKVVAAAAALPSSVRRSMPMSPPPLDFKPWSVRSDQGYSEEDRMDMFVGRIKI